MERLGKAVGLGLAEVRGRAPAQAVMRGPDQGTFQGCRAEHTPKPTGSTPVKEGQAVCVPYLCAPLQSLEVWAASPTPSNAVLQFPTDAKQVSYSVTQF